MTTLVGYASLACVAAGIVAAGVVLLVSRSGRLALRVALDLWVAAGLLRLALPPQWDQLLGTAAIIAVRQLVTVALTPRGGDPG
ncbi:DUF1622 domain-containing protein [Polymorphospora rubra]|uniref:DUF1622 domain-containing protein n=1 Tax=Polymorphospora rubra TaxID=338584 RepID=A0A810NE00_9ACTN|nr:DUF1622 domain-containing protein [Polymorphospora rubra]BCJ70289.1 hypothetical protein Prubr_73100 [Polymorphospora rubra]